MTNKPFLSVVLPCRNQADHIGRVLERYFTPLDGIGRPYELVVVPNASTDGTNDVVRRIAAADSRVTMVENPQGGWGRSVLCGLRSARGDLLCYTNSARTDPRHVVELLALYEAHAPCLAKVRRANRHAPLREIGSLLYNLEGRLLFGVESRDVNGTPKIFSRQLFEALRLESEGDLIDMECIARARQVGVKLVELPVQGFQRHGGKSSTTFKSAWNMYAGAWRLSRKLASTRQAPPRKVA